MTDINNQIKRVETAAELTKRASLMNAKAAAVNLGDETLILLKMLAAKIEQIETGGKNEITS